MTFDITHDAAFIDDAPDLTIPLLFCRRVDQTPGRTAYREYDRSAGEWQDITWRQMAARVAAFQSALGKTGLVPGDRVGVQPLFGGEFAVFKHEGAYEQLVEVYEMLLGAWLPQSGREVRDSPCVEIYRKSPFEASSLDTLVTEVCIPLVTRR